MIKIEDKADCCGCTACASICPHNAIQMKPDVLGFLYPDVDIKKCVDCGLCEKVCAFNDKYDKSRNLLEPIAYAARHKDINEVERSRSGAVFAAISDYILECGGVVYGAGYTDRFRVVHKRAVTKEERDEFRGSKYVQSDLNNVFKLVKQDLKNGKVVLFSGTPCQTSGLNSYIGGKLRENLYLVDVVCHGVPSPYIWRDYIAYLEKKQGSKICWVNFRDKQKFGWAAHHGTIQVGKKIIAPKPIYTNLFYAHIMLRLSCEKCYFTNKERPSDLTIADFWGWEKSVPNLNKDDKGISLILVNTEKGKNVLNKIINKLSLFHVKFENCTPYNPCLVKPFPANKHRGSFERDYYNHGFMFIYYKYVFCHKCISFVFFLKNKIRNILR